MFIALLLSSSMHYSGFGILAMNSTSIFAEAGSVFTPIQSTIFVKIVQFFACNLNMFLIDRFGRRYLLIVSCAGGAIGMTILSLYQFFKSDLPNANWVPIGCIIFSIFFLAIGIESIPSIIIIDILPTKVINCRWSIEWIPFFPMSIQRFYNIITYVHFMISDFKFQIYVKCRFCSISDSGPSSHTNSIIILGARFYLE